MSAIVAINAFVVTFHAASVISRNGLTTDVSARLLVEWRAWVVLTQDLVESRRFVLLS